MRSKDPKIFNQLTEYVSSYQDTHGTTPSTRQIAAVMGISIATVSRYLNEMKNQGIIDYEGRKEVIFNKKDKLAGYTPIVGNIACGPLMLAEENITDYVKLPEVIFGQGEFFILKARGESMIEAGIDSGDYVVVKKQGTAEAGQIVVALVDEEATLKRYYPEPERHRIRLHPENEQMDDIYVSECIIQGVAVNVIKSIR